MRIVILADPLDTQSAGISTYTRQLIISLIRYDSLNEYILIRYKEDESLKGLKQIAVSNFIRFLKQDPFRLFFKIPRIIRKINPDVVIEPAHFGPFNLPRHIKRITVIHDLSPIKFPHLHEFKSSVLQRIFLPHILRKADLIISNSECTRNDILDFYPFTKTKVKRIYLGRNQNFVRLIDESVLIKYNINKPYFLYVGTIEPRKNLSFLLKAYNKFRSETKLEYELVIAGKKGWKCKEFFEKLKQSLFKEDIKVLGYIEESELPALYSSAVAFIYSSLYEGFGLPLLEAMSCGTPCIISDSSSLIEVGGDAVLKHSLNNISELTSNMVLISNNDPIKAELSSRSLKQSLKFSWKSYVEEFNKYIFEEIIVKK